MSIFKTFFSINDWQFRLKASQNNQNPKNKFGKNKNLPGVSRKSKVIVRKTLKK